MGLSSVSLTHGFGSTPWVRQVAGRSCSEPSINRLRSVAGGTWHSRTIRGIRRRGCAADTAVAARSPRADTVQALSRCAAPRSLQTARLSPAAPSHGLGTEGFGWRCSQRDELTTMNVAVDAAAAGSPASDHPKLPGNASTAADPWTSSPRRRAAGASDRCRRDGKAHVAPKPFALTPPQCPPASEQRPSLAAGCGHETLVRVIAAGRERGHKTSMRHRGSLVILLASAVALSTGSANGAVPAHRGHPPMPRPSASKPKASTPLPAAPKPAARPHR
jgi:hypothetical protein